MNVLYVNIVYLTRGLFPSLEELFGLKDKARQIQTLISSETESATEETVHDSPKWSNLT